MRKKHFALASVILLLAAFLQGCGGASHRSPQADYPLKPVAFNRVLLTDEFWAPKLRTNRTVSIPFAFKMNEETGRVDNFRKAAGLMEGPHIGRRFNDTDIYKAIEGASYSLTLHPDSGLDKELDDLIMLIAAAQEPDGYLYTGRTIDPDNPAAGAGPERWYHLNGSHELYNSGHLFEAAVAHFIATGKRSLLDIAIKNADLLVRTFGPEGKKDIPGHQEIEIGLAKLYRVTAKKAYLDLAKFFLDQRGQPHESHPYPSDSPFALYNGRPYMQDHMAVLEQDKAVGHAVRATYMYAGMADVAALGDHPEYALASDRLWKDVVGGKMYLTGGVGARGGSEAFGDPYELPNARAYTETCAAIGNALWNHRLFLLHGDAKYMDIFERILYNGLLSGVSLSGDRFFYQNPLESWGRRERSPWFEVACCPPNITRFLPSLSGHVYATQDDVIFVSLFIAGTGEIDLSGKQIILTQKTRYPWEGRVAITVEPEKKGPFGIALRIPGWARNEVVPGDLYRFLDEGEEEPWIKVNGETVNPPVNNGYANLRRSWSKGDVIELFLPMPARRVVAHGAVQENRGKTALQRGPIVYCAEGVDNRGHALDLVLPDEVGLDAEFRTDLLNGVVVLAGMAVDADPGGSDGAVERTQPFRAVPYYAWANRTPGEMVVWLPRTPEAVQQNEPVRKKR